MTHIANGLMNWFYKQDSIQSIDMFPDIDHNLGSDFGHYHYTLRKIWCAFKKSVTYIYTK